jgi:hypothetical protein
MPGGALRRASGETARLSVVMWLEEASASRSFRSCASKRAPKFSSSMSISSRSLVEEDVRRFWLFGGSCPKGSSDADGRSLESRFDAIMVLSLLDTQATAGRVAKLEPM